MIFSSIFFMFVFLPVTLLLYFLVPGKVKNLVLLLCSLVFYAWGEPVYIFLMMFSILFNYISGIELERHRQKQEEGKLRLCFWTTVAANLAILGFFKYYGFFILNLNKILPFDIPYKELALPIGISFYTFQTLSYIIDVYRGKVEVQKNLIYFGTYVTMFPQLIAGPIVRYADVEKQLRSRNINIAKFGDGVLWFLRGLGKKVLLANNIGMVFDTILAMGAGERSVLTAWVGCLAYTMQIYYDFSGYSDMAIGLGKMFGFEFMKNFEYPYISKSITEFWRRWHISLGTWFREYVYIPLGGNRVTVPKHIRNILVVWIASVGGKIFFARAFGESAGRVLPHLYNAFGNGRVGVLFRAIHGTSLYLFGQYGRDRWKRFGGRSGNLLFDHKFSSVSDYGFVCDSESV